jgi:multiple sugar transport system ATP-binding protein
VSSLRFEHVDKIYENGFKAVSDFNLNINHGEFVVFVGPSGCGKSTMMRIISGLERLTKGNLFFDDKIVNDKTPRQRGIAMVFQSYALYPHLDVYENMAFGLSLEGFDEDFIEKRVHEIADVLDMRRLLLRRPRELSGGQNQRVAVGRALIRHPNVFLMDEPLSNLDAKNRVTMRSEIIDIHRKVNATTIYVTHDQTEAMTMADKIVVMRDGKIQQVGIPKQLYFHPDNKFVAGFLGEPPMNFVPCIVQNSKLKIEGVQDCVDCPPKFAPLLARFEGKSVTMGFRPESVVYDSDIANSLDVHSSSSISRQGIKLECKIQVSEILGDAINVYVFLGKNAAVLKSLPTKNFVPDQNLKFFVPQDCIYFFETDGDEKTVRV